MERYDQMLEEMKQKVGIEIKATAVKDFLFLTGKIDIDNNIVNDPFCKGPFDYTIIWETFAQRSRSALNSYLKLYLEYTSVSDSL